MPGVLPPEPALLDWALLSPPVSDSHLAPCPYCGLPNGLSASSCWSCEANLLALEPFRHKRALRSAALAPVAASAHDDESVPLLTSAVEGNEPVAALPMTAVPTAGRRRHTWAVGASTLVAAVSVVGAFLYFDTPVPPGAGKSSGFVADLAGADNAPTAVAEPRMAALRALAVEPDASTAAQASQSAAPAAVPIDEVRRHAAPPPAAPAALRATHAGKGRSAARAPSVATALAVPRTDRSDAARQAPAPARPCTPTVAALGLCAAPLTESKE